MSREPVTTEDLMITKDNGEIVTRQYIRTRAMNRLYRFRHIYSLEERRAAIAATVGNDEWIKRKYGQTVSSVLRAVEAEL